MAEIYATAKFAYAAANADGLNLEQGDRILITTKDASGWWKGTCVASQASGWFPASFVAEEVGGTSSFFYVCLSLTSAVMRPPHMIFIAHNAQGASGGGHASTAESSTDGLQIARLAHHQGPDLPAPWQEVTADGKTYYFNTVTQGVECV